MLVSIDDWVLWIFVISYFPTFLSSRNPFPQFHKILDLENVRNKEITKILKNQ